MLPLSKVRELVGWLSGDIPELHNVPVPRLAESLERFLEASEEKHCCCGSHGWGITISIAEFTALLHLNKKGGGTRVPLPEADRVGFEPTSP